MSQQDKSIPANSDGSDSSKKEAPSAPTPSGGSPGNKGESSAKGYKDGFHTREFTPVKKMTVDQYKGSNK